MRNTEGWPYLLHSSLICVILKPVSERSQRNKSKLQGFDQ
ncbi:hypothetical protein HMPREF3193_00165 [Bifidobacterium breve]|nr:hypothetical protein HMPREF1587_00216 [Bifidobacterium breve JCP7499]KWZ86777.1 hypothetical protein HMPREF3193_00165 [Bifidobacterium breve]